MKSAQLLAYMALFMSLCENVLSIGESKELGLLLPGQRYLVRAAISPVNINLIVPPLTPLVVDNQNKRYLDLVNSEIENLGKSAFATAEKDKKDIIAMISSLRQVMAEISKYISTFAESQAYYRGEILLKDRGTETCDVTLSKLDSESEQIGMLTRMT